MRKMIGMFLLQLLCCSATFADSASDDLTRLLGQLHTMRASFTQSLLNGERAASLKSEGQMSLSRPGQFRWEVIHPNKQLIITNRNKLWIYDPDLEQVTIRTLTKEAGEAPALLLSSSNQKLTESFDITHIQLDSSPLKWFALTPKAKNSMFALIRIGFSGNQIQQMQLQDHLGHTTWIQFHNVKMNVALSPSLFIFHSPAKVDVIDETHS